MEKTNYIFEDVKPYIPDINLEELQKIEIKLQDFTSGKSTKGLTSGEAEKFLDWVTYNARSYAVKAISETIETNSMTGQCALTQSINKKLLKRFGLDVRAFNTAECIGEIPINENDRLKIQRGLSSPAVRHSVLLAKIPMIDQSGNTQIYEFILDPTFRQFCIKENCDVRKFTDKDSLEHGHVAPHPGFFMQKENLIQLGETEEVANNSEMLCKTLIHKGYFNLNEQTAKLYGNAFARASTRLEFQNYPIKMSGQDYINNFENTPMKTIGMNNQEQFLKLPSEIAKSKMSIFKKIKNFFIEKFSKKPKELSVGIGKENKDNNIRIPGAKLSPEEFHRVQKGTAEVVANYMDRTNNSNAQSTVSIDNSRE